jgi:ABC-2 type transport system ATP-binding protein
MTVVEVTGLRKRYREREAVRDVSFAVRRGEVFGIAGRNGAGKTTTVECVLGLRTPDGGAVRVLGMDPVRERARVARKLGAQLQECELPEKIRVGEAAALYASFHEQPADWRALLDRVGLADRLRTPVKKLSGGQRQRLFIALALVGDPEVVVFDELTTGLDPQARRDIWELVEDVRARGVTVLLVTHLMEEAERLCDRVAVIDRGRVLALDTPAGLVAGADVPARVVCHVDGALDERRLTELPQVTGVRRSGARVEVTGRGELGPAVLGALAGSGVGVTDLLTHRPTLDDAFLAMTAAATASNTEEK